MSESSTTAGSQKLASSTALVEDPDILESFQLDPDIIVLSDQFGEMSFDGYVGVLQEELRSVSKQLDDAKQQLEDKDKEMKAKTDMRAKYANEIYALGKDLADMMALEKRLTREINQLKEASESHKSHAEELGAKCKSLELMLAERDKEIKRLESEKTDAQTRLRDELLSKQSEVESTKFKLSFAEKNEKLAMGQLTEARDKLAAFIDQAEEREALLIAECQHQKEMSEWLEKERNNLASKCKSLMEKADEERVGLKAQFEAWTKKVELSKPDSTLKAQLEALARENAVLKSKVAMQDIFLNVYKNETSLAKSKVCSLTEELAKSPSPERKVKSPLRFPWNKK